MTRPARYSADTVPVELVCPACGMLAPTHLVNFIEKDGGRVIHEGTRRELLPHGRRCTRTDPKF